MPHENHIKIKVQSPFAIDMILAVVKMHGKTSCSLVPHENHVKMKAPSQFAIDMILAAVKMRGKT